jgi:hypothetical protein
MDHGDAVLRFFSLFGHGMPCPNRFDRRFDAIGRTARSRDY